MEGGKPENPEKNPWSKDENQQQTQPTCDARSGNRTQATSAGSERYLARGNNLPWPIANPKCLIRKRSSYFKIEITTHNCRGCKGVTPRKIGWGCAACFRKSLLLKIKICEFPNPIYDLTKNSTLLYDRCDWHSCPKYNL